MMTEIKYGAVLMAAAHKQGVELEHDDALTVLKYMGIDDQCLVADRSLKVMALRRHIGGRKFTDTLCNILGAVKAAAAECVSLMEYTLKTENGRVASVRDYQSDLLTLNRLVDTYSHALA